MNFTTEKRRELTSSIAQEAKQTELFEKGGDAMNSIYGQKVEEDKTNRELFRLVNSQLSGYAFEYGLMTGYYHPMLLEEEYKYIVATNEHMTETEERTFWGCPKMRSAAALEEGNEFHLNLNEGSTVWYPEHPLKYSRWVNDTHEEVSMFSPTEDEYFDMIRNLITWYNSGGSGGGSEITIFGAHAHFSLGLEMSKQPYMTVGYTEYIAGGGGFMTDGYDPIGDIITVNGGDINNFSIGKVVDAKTSPSRILYVPYVIVGEIPDNSVITSTYVVGSPIYLEMIANIMQEMLKKYRDVERFLQKNPDGDIIENVDVLEEIGIVIGLLEGWLETSVLNDLNGVITSIETLRHSSRELRKSYIVDFLVNHPELYEDRFKIMDIRLSKRMGTLREVMRNRENIDFMFAIQREKSGFLEYFGKYFLTIKCELDGDWKRRVFIQDPRGIFSVGDEVYILTDDIDIPEIRAVIDVIVNARLQIQSSKMDEKGEPIIEYMSCKKIFFKDAWLNGEVKMKRFFPTTYLIADNFRIIKQI